MRRLIPALALLLLASGCSGTTGPGVATVADGPSNPASSGAPASDPDARLRQYAGCLRDHGLHVTDPAPGQAGIRMNPNDSPQAAQRAIQACMAYAAANEAPTPPSAADLAALRQYARCMREHGVPSFPDPDPQTGVFSGLDKSNYDPTSASIKTAIQACQALAPAVPPGG